MYVKFYILIYVLLSKFALAYSFSLLVQRLSCLAEEKVGVYFLYFEAALNTDWSPMTSFSTVKCLTMYKLPNSEHLLQKRVD